MALIMNSIIIVIVNKIYLIITESLFKKKINNVNLKLCFLPYIYNASFNIIQVQMLF